MKSLQDLLDGNRAWAADTARDNPEMFERQAKGQTPRHLWIGCSDSRVPPSRLCRADPGDIFVLRNIANQVRTGEVGAAAVLQFAVDVLQVRHIIVCGHTRCGGVAAALQGGSTGPLQDWLGGIREVIEEHQHELDSLAPDDKINRLCELNVQTQVRNIVGGSTVQGAWARGQDVFVHGWVYGVHDGLLRNLEVTASRPRE